MKTKIVNINIKDIEKNIKKIRKLWVFLYTKKKKLVLNNLNSAETLMLINKISIKKKLVPLGINLQFSIDNPCNGKCIMCGYHRMIPKKNKGYDNFDKILELIDVPISKIRILGFGEPLFYKKNLLNLIAKMKNKTNDIEVITNGALLTPNYIDELKKNGLEELTISLDSYNQEEHDKIRGVEGLYKNIIKSILYIKKTYPDFKIVINAVVMHINVNSIFKLILLTNKLKVDSIMLSYIHTSLNNPNHNKLKLTKKDKTKLRKIRLLTNRLPIKTEITWDLCNLLNKQGTSPYGCRLRYIPNIQIDNNYKIKMCYDYYKMEKEEYLDVKLSAFLKKPSIWKYFEKESFHCPNFYPDVK